MRASLARFRRKIQQWMIGRYGTDELSRTLVVIALILMIIGSFTGSVVASLVSWALFIWGYYRCLSKNIIKRSRERDNYLRLIEPLKRKISLWKRMWNDRNSYRYFKCPNCKKMIRVPKGKGKIAISCKNCRTEIIRKS